MYVDSSKLLNGYKGMIDARKDYDKKNIAWRSNVDSLSKDVENAIKAYSKELSTGTDKEKKLSKELIQSKQRDLMEYQNAVKQDAAQEESKLNEKVFTVINAYMQKFGKMQGYKMILIAANGNIAYADASIDITDRVIQDLNKEYDSIGK